MGNKLIKSFVLISCLVSANLFSQHLPVSEIFKIEASFRNGEFERSEELSNKLAKSLSKKDSYNRLVYSQALLYKIKNSFITRGTVEDVLELEQVYLEESRKIDEQGMSYFAKGLGEIAKIYAENGYQSLANERIQKAYNLLIKYPNAEIKEYIDLANVQVLNSTGEYKKAFELAKNIQNTRLQKVNIAYDFTVPNANSALKGEYKSKYYSAVKRDYADFLNLMALIKYNEGNYIQADSLASVAYFWIIENIDAKGRDVSAFDNRLLVINLHEKLDQDETAYSFTFNKNVGSKKGLKHSYEKSFDSYSYFQDSKAFMEYEEYLARHYWSLHGLKVGMKSTADGYYAKHHSFYSRIGHHGDNVNIVKAEIMLVDKAILENDWQRAKILTDSLLKRKKSDFSLLVKENHPLRRQLLLKGLEIDAHLLEQKSVVDKINELQKIDKLLLVQNSPNDIKDKLFISSYNYKILGEYQNTLKDFENYYLDKFEHSLHPLHKDSRVLAEEYVDLLITSGQFALAKKMIDQSLKKIEPFKFRNPNQYALHVLKKAKLQLLSGEYKEAAKILNESKTEGEIYAMITDNSFEVKSTQDEYFRTLTHKNIVFGDIVAAKKSMLSISRLTETDYVDFTKVFVSIGKIDFINEKLLEIKSKYKLLFGDNNVKSIPVLQSLAYVQTEYGDFGEALKNVNQASNISRDVYGENSYQFADATFATATVTTNFGDYSTAYTQFGEAKNLYKKIYGEKNVQYARSMSEMGLARLFNNEIDDEIEKDFLTASNIVKNSIGFTSFENANIVKNQAFYYLEKGRVDYAERDIQQSIQILSDLGEGPYKKMLAENYRINAKIQQYNKEYKSSETSFKKALSYYNDIYDNKEHLDITQTRSGLAQLYYLQGDRRDSKNEINATTDIYFNYIDKYFSYLTDREKKEFWKKISQDFEFYKTIAFESNNKKEIENVYNDVLKTKGILLTSSKKLRQAILNSKDEEVKKTYDDWSNKQQQLTRALAMSSDQLKEEGIVLDALQRDIDKLEKTLNEKSKDFAQESVNESLTWENVRDALKTNEFAVEIIRYHKFTNKFTDTIVYKALIIGKDYTTPKVVDFGDGNKLEDRYLSYYRNTTKFKKKDNVSYKVFYEPIYKVVGEKATVYLSLDGAFNLLNVETLLMPDGSYVLDKNQIIIVSSTKDIVNKKLESVSVGLNKSAVFVSNPMYYTENLGNVEHQNNNPDHPIKQLPGTEIEGNTSQALFSKDNWQTKLYAWDNADENVIKNLGKEGTTKISYLHISTHGFFESSDESNSLASNLDSRKSINDPYLRSGLVFKNGGDAMWKQTFLNYNLIDGVLTSREIAPLNLTGVDICVLSACETGLGDVAAGEGVYGLQRAFLTAGVKYVIISLFKVDDAVTQYFMNKMDEKFIETNNIRVAMDFAKKETQRLYPEPIYWGSFVLMD
jgi:CHAT domain-containing protein